MSRIEPLAPEAISDEAKQLATDLHHQARTEVVYTICEHALRDAWLRGYLAASEINNQQIEILLDEA